MKTSLGFTNSAGDAARNAWTTVLDAANFAGPITYTLPQYWEGYKYRASLPDFSNSGLKGNGGGFEFGTIPLLTIGPELMTQVTQVHYGARV